MPLRDDAMTGRVVRRGALDELQLAHDSAAVAGVVTQGAHVTTWRPRDGQDVIFLGSTTEFARGRTIRGGIPIVFPQFAELGPLPKHGIVRTLDWRVRHHSDATAVLELTGSEDTRGVWPHDFTLVAYVELAADALEVRLDVTNTGAAPFGFTCALHTYLRVGDVEQSAIRGLKGRHYLDKTRGGESRRDAGDELRVGSEIDRVYGGGADVELLDTVLERTLVVRSTGFTNTVIWNPWRARVRDFSGLAAGDYRNFICIEPAVVTEPVVLEPRGIWTGSQQISLRPPPAPTHPAPTR